MSEVLGKVLQVMQPVTGEGRNGAWKKQEFLIETNDQYPKKVIFSVWGDKVSMLNSLTPGIEVKVSFNPESREFNGRWYTDLRAWKIDANNVTTPSTQTFSAPPQQNFDPPIEPVSEYKDDLPF